MLQENKVYTLSDNNNYYVSKKVELDGQTYYMASKIEGDDDFVNIVTENNGEVTFIQDQELAIKVLAIAAQELENTLKAGKDKK